MSNSEEDVRIPIRGPEELPERVSESTVVGIAGVGLSYLGGSYVSREAMWVARILGVRFAHLYVSRGIKHVMIGSSAGTDRIAANEILSLRAIYPEFELSLILPYKRFLQGVGRVEMAGLIDAEMAYSHIFRANTVYEIAKDPRGSLLLFHTSNVLVSAVDILYVVWTGSNQGETISIIHSAWREQKEVWIINPATLGFYELKD